VPKDENYSAKFLYIYFNLMKDYVLVPLMKGSANVSLTLGNLKKAKVPDISLETQLKIVELYSKIKIEQDKSTDLLAEQKDDITLLREAILQEAVKGKLTKDWRANNPIKENASRLLKRIQDVKEQLIKDKKIKNEKALTPIAKEEIPYELPDSWVWSKLGAISNVVGGGTPKSSNPEYFCQDGIPWFTPADLGKSKSKYVEKGRRDITELGLKKSSAQLMPKGSVMFSSRAPIGHIAIGLKDFSTNQGFKSSVPYLLDMNEFIYYYLKSIVKETNENASGTTFKEVSGLIVKNFIFPLPSLEEQKVIIQKVNELMGLCDELEQQLHQSHEQIEHLMQSVLREVFEGKKSI
jgi:type I restriction enzyme S subunit